ncbi:MAG: type II secretion system protein GspL [Moraxellaceae bacterium]|nr:type II secretion system protein GspL [Moraxellaceae bacterium]
MDCLFLRLPAPGEALLQAIQCRQGQWSTPAFGLSLDDFTQQFAESRDLTVCVLTPVGHDIALVLEATAKQRREAGLGLVSMVEDQLSEDYENLHWTLSPIDEHHTLARGINKQWLRHWLESLTQAGFSPEIALPEASLLASDAENWVLYPVGEEVFLQADPGQSALVLAHDLPMLLDSLLSSRKTSTPVRLRYPQSMNVPAVWPEAIQAAPAAWQSWPDLLRSRDKVSLQKHSQNWLFGEFAVIKKSDWSPRWRVAAVALFAVILLQGSLNYVEASRLAKQAAEAELQTSSLFRQLFPTEQRIVNLERQVNARLAMGSQQSASTVLQLIAETAPSEKWQVQHFELRQNGLVHVDITGDDLAGTQQWLTRLGARGMAATIENAKFEGGVATARLVLQKGSRS